MLDVLVVLVTLGVSIVQTYIFYNMSKDPALTGVDQVNQAFLELVLDADVAAALQASVTNGFTGATDSTDDGAAKTSSRINAHHRAFSFFHTLSLFSDNLPKKWWRGMTPRLKPLLQLLGDTDADVQLKTMVLDKCAASDMFLTRLQRNAIKQHRALYHRIAVAGRMLRPQSGGGTHTGTPGQ